MSDFDKKQFSQLLKLAQGKRSLNQFGLNANVDPGYLSRFINLKRDTPPSPEVLQKIAAGAHNDVTYDDLMQSAGYIEKDIDDTSVKSNDKESLKEKYPDVHDVEEAMKVILEQPGLMLKGELLSDESKIILANAIQMGLRTAEEIEKKKNKGDMNE